MSRHPIRVEPDGTRVYTNGRRYRPKPPEERVYGVRKPDDPRAVRFHGKWFLPLELLDDEQRVMPETRPDEQTLEHKPWCRCQVCRRPQAKDLWTRARRAAGRGT